VSISDAINNKSFYVENELLEISEDLRKSNLKGYSEKIHQLPLEIQNKIVHYQWKILGKPEDFQSEEFSPVDLENHSCSNEEKIEAIEKLLIHRVKKHLLSIADDFKNVNEVEAYSKFAQVCELSKRVKILEDLENDIYFQIWKIHNKPSHRPQIDEQTFKKSGDNDKKSLAIEKYIKVLSSLKSLNSSEKSDQLCLDLFREKAGIEVVGSKKFRNLILNDIKKLLNCEIGMELFSYILSRSDHLLNITEWKECMILNNIEYRDFYANHFIVMISEQSMSDILVPVINPENNVIELREQNHYIGLAHELSHYFLRLTNSSCQLEKPVSIFYPNLEEELVITGKSKSIQCYKFSENEFRKAFHLPPRLGYDLFFRDGIFSPLHYACLFGSPESADHYLRLGFNANLMAPDGSTPLHIACQSPLVSEDPAKVEKLIDLLIANGAKIQSVDKGGYTPLHYLATTISNVFNKDKTNNGCLFEVYDYLVAKGADPTVSSVSGSTPNQLLWHITRAVRNGAFGRRQCLRTVQMSAIATNNVLNDPLEER
jgi:hypothetical protein